MKPQQFTLLVALFVCAFLSMPATTNPSASSIDAVLAAEKARSAALVSGDTKALDRLLADDLRYVHSNGRVQTKKDVIDGLADGTTAYSSFSTEKIHSNPVTADVVVLSGTLNQRKFGNGKWTEAQLLFQAVWRKSAQGWQLVNIQTVKVPEAR